MMAINGMVIIALSKKNGNAKIFIPKRASPTLIEANAVTIQLALESNEQIGDFIINPLLKNRHITTTKHGTL